tara:strand:- start:237 stop:449 length:213 start_codon:yes stop_codon:yes gene_type:complete
MDNKLTKYIRPSVLITLVVNTIVLIYLDSFSESFNVRESWVSLLEIILITVIGAYFGGRSFEKIKNNKAK